MILRFIRTIKRKGLQFAGIPGGERKKFSLADFIIEKSQSIESICPVRCSPDRDWI